MHVKHDQWNMLILPPNWNRTISIFFMSIKSMQKHKKNKKLQSMGTINIWSTWEDKKTHLKLYKKLNPKIGEKINNFNERENLTCWVWMHTNDYHQSKKLIELKIQIDYACITLTMSSEFSLYWDTKILGSFT